ncbi:unnamed protein product [marine sediment metagenome]|uniref:Uncharacterized protein n=1 Tax=marine sediment metagenome TaxID=412755 RepID=X1MKP1_9ZZZZ
MDDTGWLAIVDISDPTNPSQTDIDDLGTLSDSRGVFVKAPPAAPGSNPAGVLSLLS